MVELLKLTKKEVYGVFSKKDLQKLIIPLIIEQILAVTVGMTDTIMVSIRGEAAVSGVSLVESCPINRIIFRISNRWCSLSPLHYLMRYVQQMM